MSTAVLPAAELPCDVGAFVWPAPQGLQRIRITAVRETTDDFHRVAFESLGVTPHAH